MLNETDWLDAPTRNVGGRPPKGYSARSNRKLECPSCGFACRCSTAAVKRAAALPTCGCGVGMIVPNLRDRAAIEPDALEAELCEQGRTVYNAAARELGWPHWSAPKRESRSGTSRCQWEGGYCMTFVSGRFCREHEPKASER